MASGPQASEAALQVEQLVVRLGRAGGGVGVILAAAGVRAHDERAAEGGGGQNGAGGHGACVEPTAGREGAESLEDWTRGGV